MSLTVSLERVLKAPLDIVQDRLQSIPMDQLSTSKDWDIPQMVGSIFNLQSPDASLLHKVPLFVAHQQPCRETVAQILGSSFCSVCACADAVYPQIPSLNDTMAEMIAPNSLVRFRCMIQDVLGQELYFGVYEHRDPKTGKTVRHCVVARFSALDAQLCALCRRCAPANTAMRPITRFVASGCLRSALTLLLHAVGRDGAR
jgi:hypothetical protein